MFHVVFFSFLILTAFIIAKLEIQIEGKNGWATNLPTWRNDVKIAGIKMFTITGYHLYLVLFIAIALHFPFLFMPWTIKNELFILAFYFLCNPLEDFLWYVLNPAYGIKKFNAEHAPWFTSWFIGLPIGYWIYLPLGIGLYLAASNLLI